MIIRTLSVVFALCAQPCEALAATDTGCELHIWTTRSYYAVFNGANVAAGGGGAVSIQLTLSPMEQVRKRLAESIDEEAQVDAIKGMALDTMGRFSGYHLVFHSAPAEPKYGNWIAKNVGEGGRDTDSTARCYAELHVIFITLFRTALSKKIQTAFLFRDFGAGSTARYTAVDAGSTGAPAFKTTDVEKSDAARGDVKDAFQENLRILLRKKKMALRS